VIYISDLVVVFEGIAGEVLTTCSKLLWIVDSGEDVLKSQYRPSGIMMPHKVARLDCIHQQTAM
jgi:hypothetical protein